MQETRLFMAGFLHVFAKGEIITMEK